MTNQNQKTCEFSFSKGDTEYLYAFLEKQPENHRDYKTHSRILGVVMNELQKHQVNWMRNKNRGAN